MAASDQDVLARGAVVMEHRWRVGIVEINSLGLYLLERLKLDGRFEVVRAVDIDAGRERISKGFASSFSSNLNHVLTDPIDCVIFTGANHEELLRATLLAGKSAVIAKPWLWPWRLLQSVNELSLESTQCVTTFCPRRWSSDFLSAAKVMKSERLGKILTAANSVRETCIPDKCGVADFLREQTFHLLDQLLLFVDSKPIQVFATSTVVKPGGDQTGSVLVVEFSNGCVAQIDLQFQSRLGVRTGWTLEGDQGSYRNHRLYTTTAAGEIVDEPVPITNPSDEKFFDDLSRRLHGQEATLPTLTQAIRVGQLIEVIEQSVATGKAIRC